MLLRIQHETRLSYSEPVTETMLEVRMGPPSTEDQANLGFRLVLAPSAFVTVYSDGFGNRVDMFNIMSPYRELLIRASSIVQTHRRPGDDRLGAVQWEPERAIPLDAQEFLYPSPLVDRDPDLAAFTANLPEPRGSLREIVDQLMQAVRERLRYEKKVTTANTPVGEALRLERGVCQDFAHLFIGAARGLGIPARYVSGYLHQPGEIATHAWCQVWGGPAGWVDVDPTPGHFAGDDHVVIAIGRDYADVPPNRGVFKGTANETITVSVTVEPIERMPIDWAEWAAPTIAPLATWSNINPKPRRPRSSVSGKSKFFQQQQQQQ
jgi:transglutaminase-like putative cysteine protease